MWQPKELDEADTKLLLVVVVVGRIEEILVANKCFCFSSSFSVLFGSSNNTDFCVSAAAVICKYAFVCLVIVVSCIFSSSLTTITKKTYTLEALKNVHQVFHYNFFFGILCLYAKGSYLIFPTHKKERVFGCGKE